MFYVVVHVRVMFLRITYSFFFFFNDTATTEIYTLSLHDALPIRYPATKTQVGAAPALPRRARSRLTRLKTSTIGATDGSIIAPIIVTQIPRYHPTPPRSVPGPASMPCIRW